MATYTPQQLGISAPAGGFQQGAWYQSRNYWNGTLSDPGVKHPESGGSGAGQAVSQETVQQTNPDNWQYIQQQQVSASSIQAPVNVPLPTTTTSSGLTEELAAATKLFEQNLAQRATQTQEQLTAARAKEEGAVKGIEAVSHPFAEKLQQEGEEEFGITKNMQEYNALTDRLEVLLTEGQELIRQQKEVTGLASIRNPRIQQTMEDVASQAAIIESVLSARLNGMAAGQNIIDKRIGAIQIDRQYQLNYYNTILKLADRDIIELTAESRKIADAQSALLETKMNNAQETVDTIKNLMINPDKALLMAQAGVSLNDSVEVIQAKMAQAQYAIEIRDMSNDFTMSGGIAITDPSSVPADQLRSFTDSRGQVHYYKITKSGGGISDDLSYVNSLVTTGATQTQAVSSQPPQMSAIEGTRYVDGNGVEWVSLGASGWRRVN